MIKPEFSLETHWGKYWPLSSLYMRGSNEKELFEDAKVIKEQVFEDQKC